MITEKFANHIGYSDVNPYEIVRVVSDQTIEIREMDAELANKEDLKHVVGGFSGVCVNQGAQEWNITSNESYKVERIRFSKAKNRWQSKGGRRFVLSDAPRKFYDFNF